MNLLVLGYYDRGNLGDEMFKLTMPTLFPNSKLTFVCTDDFDGKYNKYDGIVCGGGDIVNDYFNHKINKLLLGYKGLLFAVGIGIPYPGLIRKGYLDIYDHVFIRERTDLLKIQRRLGSQYAHYIPDLGFALEFPKDIVRDYSKENKKIGVFLAQSLYKHKSVFFGLCQFIAKVAKNRNYEIILYRFNTSGSPVEDDKFINTIISFVLGAPSRMSFGVVANECGMGLCTIELPEASTTSMPVNGFCGKYPTHKIKEEHVTGLRLCVLFRTVEEKIYKECLKNEQKRKRK